MGTIGRVCIDPGMRNGIAIFSQGKLVETMTMTPIGLVDYLRELSSGSLVLFEDSRMQSGVWSAKKARTLKAKMKIARDVGSVDSWCYLIKLIRPDATGVSPKNKGRKILKDEFKIIYPEYSGRTNQHERDAAMLNIYRR